MLRNVPMAKVSLGRWNVTVHPPAVRVPETLMRTRGCVKREAVPDQRTDKLACG